MWTHPAPTSLARTLCNTNLLPRCASRAETILQPDCFTLGFQTSSVVLQSWCRAVSCLCWLFAARAGCVSPSPVWAKHCPGSPMNKWHWAHPRLSCTGVTPSGCQKSLHLSWQRSKNTANKNNLVLSDKEVTFWAVVFFFFFKQHAISTSHFSMFYEVKNITPWE